MMGRSCLTPRREENTSPRRDSRFEVVVDECADDTSDNRDFDFAASPDVEEIESEKGSRVSVFVLVGRCADANFCCFGTDMLAALTVADAADELSV